CDACAAAHAESGRVRPATSKHRRDPPHCDPVPGCRAMADRSPVPDATAEGPSPGTYPSLPAGIATSRVRCDASRRPSHPTHATTHNPAGPPRAPPEPASPPVLHLDGSALPKQCRSTLRPNAPRRPALARIGERHCSPTHATETRTTAHGRRTALAEPGQDD